MTQYLVLADLATARSRSATEADARNCTGITDYWWATITHPSNGQAAVVIEDAGDYGSSGLIADELAALQDQAALQAAGWFPVRGGS